MTKTYTVCDHCADQGDIKQVEYDGYGMDLCDGCVIGFKEYVEEFVRVRSISASAHFKDKGMKSL